jgi:glutaconate CoA-transferase subunit A
LTDESKLMTMKEAIRKFVPEGSLIYLGGWAHLYPYSIVFELIRQRKKDLTLVKHSPELMADMLIGAGCLKKLLFGWVGNAGISSCHAFRRAIEKNIPRSLEIEEYTHFALGARLKAGAMGIPFLPTKSMAGSDLLKHNSVARIMNCPFTAEDVCVVPAINPDVGLLHVQRADAQGNAQVWGVIGDTRDGAFASKKVVLSAEEIVPTEEIRRDPNRTAVPGFKVDAVVEEPWGAHPSYAQGYYDRDNDFYLDYDNWTKDIEGFERFLDEWIYGIGSKSEYLRKLGVDRILRLKPRSFLSSSVNFGLYG